MAVSVSEYREGFCPACGHREVALVRLVIDLTESPELRDALQQPAAYRQTCSKCRTDRQRDTALLVLELADCAPVVLACPDRILVLDDPAAGSARIIEQAGRALEAQRRQLPGPLLPLPFDSLMIALGRDLGRDVAAPEAAVIEAARSFGSDAAQRYAIFLGEIAQSRALRDLDAGQRALMAVRSATDLERAIRQHPVLLSDETRGWLRSVVARACAAGDDLGVRIASGHLALLERCGQGKIAEGWAEFIRATGYDEYVDPQLREVWERFNEARERDLNLAATIGEEMVRLSAHFHVTGSEANACFQTAGIYWTRRSGNRTSDVERARQLLERALELCERHPDLVDEDVPDGVELR